MKSSSTVSLRENIVAELKNAFLDVGKKVF